MATDAIAFHYLICIFVYLDVFLTLTLFTAEHIVILLGVQIHSFHSSDAYGSLGLTVNLKHLTHLFAPQNKFLCQAHKWSFYQDLNIVGALISESK